MGETNEEGRESGSNAKGRRIYFFDLETQKLADEVGGWDNKRQMLVSVGVLYDYESGEYRSFTEARVPELLEELGKADLVVGFNIKSFDWEVLRRYSDMDFGAIPTLDILEDIHKTLGHRVSLDKLAKATLQEGKSADGLQAVKWFREGRMDLLTEYCRHDVEVTCRLFEFGRKNGYLLFEGRDRDMRRVSVRWAL